MSCPVGKGALAGLPVFYNDPYVARQPIVSGPKIDEMVVMMQARTWNWIEREIKRNGNVIIDGHHRYIAARLAGVTPVFVDSVERYGRIFAWTMLIVDFARWNGGY